MYTLQTPGPLKDEHQIFRELLDQAIRTGGALGKVARQLETLLDPHFKTEEEVAFPALTLLAPLSRGEVAPDMGNALALIERFRKELPKLTADHQTVTHLLDDFDTAAGKEGKTEFTRFSRDLRHHARAEEGILYPAVILIGEYLRLKL